MYVEREKKKKKRRSVLANEAYSHQPAIRAQSIGANLPRLTKKCQPRCLFFGIIKIIGSPRSHVANNTKLPASFARLIICGT